MAYKADFRSCFIAAHRWYIQKNTWRRSFNRSNQQRPRCWLWCTNASSFVDRT